jgi:hypothetical protein
VHYEFPPSDGPLDEWFAPLEAVARLIEGNPRFRFFDLGDFMVMARLVQPPMPTLLIYKHRITRRYLRLDESGRAYANIASPPDSHGSPDVRARDLARALDEIELWTLPWMKPDLEAHRQGLHWHDRWRLHPDNERLGDLGGESNGHLRLV